MPTKISGLLLLAAMLTWGGPQLSSQTSSEAKTSELYLRGWAHNQVSPEYPVHARSDHTTGIVVVEVHLEGNGKIISISMVESPSDALTNAVIAAVKRWVFTPPPTLHDARLEGKLTFYFEKERGSYRVLDPLKDSFLVDREAP